MILIACRNDTENSLHRLIIGYASLFCVQEKILNNEFCISHEVSLGWRHEKLVRLRKQKLPSISVKLVAISLICLHVDCAPFAPFLLTLLFEFAALFYSEIHSLSRYLLNELKVQKGLTRIIYKSNVNCRTRDVDQILYVQLL